MAMTAPGRTISLGWCCILLRVGLLLRLLLHRRLAEARFQSGQMFQFTEVEKDPAATFTLFEMDTVALVGAHVASAFGADQGASSTASVVGLIGRGIRRLSHASSVHAATSLEQRVS